MFGMFGLPGVENDLFVFVLFKLSSLNLQVQARKAEGAFGAFLEASQHS